MNKNPPDSEPPDTRRSTQRRVVLVVDDEAFARRALARLLDEQNVPTVAVGSAHRALEELAEGGVTVLVADERMAVMSGSVLLERARDLYPHVMRILWTAFVTPDLIDNAPAYIVLSKSGDGSFVVDTIARLHRGAP